MKAALKKQIVLNCILYTSQGSVFIIHQTLAIFFCFPIGKLFVIFPFASPEVPSTLLHPALCPWKMTLLINKDDTDWEYGRQTYVNLRRNQRLPIIGSINAELMKLKSDAKGTIGPEHKTTQNSEARYFYSRERQIILEGACMVHPGYR
ncbi:hypothetical protein MJT46_007309 [Ovis ammon polii x Ovis aries]|nr:hypothetical protein MJT46_007309 [Ovis ammon polii x Ovis aries]